MALTLSTTTEMSKPKSEGVPILIDIRSANLCVGDRVLIRDLSLTLHRGMRIGLTGPSGCGKTTLLRSIVGRKLSVFSSAQRFDLNYSRVGYVPQRGGMLPWFSLGRNLHILAPPSADSVWCEEVLDLMELSHVSNSFPDQLSGGESQRARLACAIVSQPVLCCADEPLTEVGLQQKWRLLERWSGEISRRNASLILVSHDVDTLIYLCDEIIILGGSHNAPSGVVSRVEVITTPHPRKPTHLTDSSLESIRKQMVATLYLGGSG